MKKEDFSISIEAAKDEETPGYREYYSLILHIEIRNPRKDRWEIFQSKKLGEIRSLKEINKIAEEMIEEIIRPRPPIIVGDDDYLQYF
jgi:hypothetical protein